MIPPGEIIDTQIGEATWLFLWCTVFGSAGSLALMGLYQHTDWWNLIPYIGTRASLPHTTMFPVRKRKTPQIALRNREMRQQMSDGKAAERNPIKLDTVGSDFQNGNLSEKTKTYHPPRDPSTDGYNLKTRERSARRIYDAARHSKPVAKTYTQIGFSWGQRWIALAAILMCIQLADSVNPNLQKDYTVLPPA